MKTRFFPLLAVTGLVLLICAAVSGFWLSSLPARSLIGMKEGLKRAGLDMTVKSSRLTLTGGVGAEYEDVLISSADSGFSARVAVVSIVGAWPWAVPQVVLQRPEITHVLGGVPLADTTLEQAAPEKAAQPIPPFSVVIEDGKILVADSSARNVLEMSNLSGEVEMREVDLTFRGRAGINGVRTQVRVESAEAHRLFGDGAPTDVFISAPADANTLDVQYSGRLRLTRGFAMDGRFSSAATDAQAFFALVGLPNVLPVSGALATEGGVSLASTGVGLSDLTLSQGDAEAKGRLNIRFGKDVHSIDGVLHLPKLSLPSPAVSGSWSERPFALPDFRGLAGAVAFQAQALSAGKFAAGPTQLDVKFTAEGPDLTLRAKTVEGDLEASLRVDPQQTADRFTLNARLTNQDFGPVAKAVSGLDGASGKLNGQIEIVATGNSVADALATAEGDFDLELKDGAFDGVSLKTVLSSAGDGWRASSGERTQSLGVAFKGKVKDAIAILESKSLKADGKVFAVKGEVDLLRRALALDVTPQGAKRMGIQGPWAAPKIGPDIVGAPPPLPAPDQAAADGN